MAGRDATSIESMYQNEAECASKDHCSMCQRDSDLCAKHQLRESNITLDRVYTMLAEVLTELKLHEEQDKIAQIVSGSSGTAKHSMYDEYINASKGKIPVTGKSKQGDGKGGKFNWRATCDDYFKPPSCSQGHHCPKYHPRRERKKERV